MRCGVLICAALFILGCEIDYPDGVYSCDDAACPPGLSCASDLLCYAVLPDAGPIDASMDDPDAQTDGEIVDPDAGEVDSGTDANIDGGPCANYRPDVTNRITMISVTPGEGDLREYASGLDTRDVNFESGLVGTATGIYDAIDTTTALFSAHSDGVETLVVTGALVWATGNNGDISIYPVGGGTEAVYQLGPGRVVVSRSSGPGVYYGSHEGHVYRANELADAGVTVDLEATASTGREIVSLAVETSGGPRVIAATADSRLLESEDRENFSERAVSFTGFSYVGAVHDHNSAMAPSGEPWLLMAAVGGSSPVCSGVYTCEHPCNTPTLVPTSDQIGGAPRTVNGALSGCLLAQSAGPSGINIIVAGSSEEVWIRINDSAFYLLEQATACGAHTVYSAEIRVGDGRTFISTSNGVFSFIPQEVIPH